MSDLDIVDGTLRIRERMMKERELLTHPAIEVRVRSARENHIVTDRGRIPTRIPIKGSGNPVAGTWIVDEGKGGGGITLYLVPRYRPNA